MQRNNLMPKQKAPSTQSQHNSLNQFAISSALSLPKTLSLHLLICHFP